MPDTESTPKKPKELAQAYRAENNRPGGVVIIFKGQAGGWMDKLREPHRYEPGCIAVDTNGNQFLAVGGDPYNGAEEWQALA